MQPSRLYKAKKLFAQRYYTVLHMRQNTMQLYSKQMMMSLLLTWLLAVTAMSCESINHE